MLALFKMNFKAISYYLGLSCLPVSFLSIIALLTLAYFNSNLQQDSIRLIYFHFELQQTECNKGKITV